jgi:hypothetical protein
MTVASGSVVETRAFSLSSAFFRHHRQDAYTAPPSRAGARGPCGSVLPAHGRPIPVLLLLLPARHPPGSLATSYVDLNTATEPAEAMVMRAQPGHRPGAADALNSGIQPQGHHDLGIDRGPAFHGPNGLEQGRQVEPLDELPDRAGRVFGGHQTTQMS